MSGSGAAEATGWRSWYTRFWNGYILVVLVVLAVAFTVLAPGKFATEYNISILAIDASILLPVALGQTFVIITAGIDLSVGSVLVFSSIAAAEVMLALSGAPGTTYGTTDAGWGIIAVGAVVAIASGTLWGVLNGVLVAVARIPALIVTLGTLGMALGLAQIITNGQDVRAIPQLLVDTVGQGNILGIPVLAVIALGVTVLCAILLHLTRFGVWIHAVGSNAEAARRAGIPVRSLLICVYALQGALAGFAGIMVIAQYSTTTIGGHSSDNLAAISAVVLGGTSLFGGIGTILGTVVGVFIPIVLLNGFVILGIPPFWQTVTIGAVLIVAVFVDQLKRRVREGA